MLDSIQRSKSTIKYRFPIDYYEQNLLFKRDKTCHAVYKIDGYVYDFLSKQEQVRKLNTIAKLFWNMKFEFQIKIVPVVTSIRERCEEEKRQAFGPLKMEAIYDADYIADELIESIGDEGNEYEFYLVVKLEKPKEFWRDTKEYLTSLYKDPIRVINTYAAGEDPDIFLNELEIYMSIEERVFNTINNYTFMKRANEYDIQYLIRQPFYRAIGRPPMRGDTPDNVNPEKNKGKKYWKPKFDIVERNGKQAIRPYRRDILTLTDGPVDIYRTHLEIKRRYNGHDVSGQQAFMVVSDIPDLDFPGCEWIYGLTSNTRFPVDISIRVKPVETKKALGKVREEKKKIKDQDEHTQSSNVDVPLDLLESKDEADMLEYHLKKSKFPLLFTTIVIAVAAKDKETLKMRQDDIKNHLDGYSIHVECPSGDQWDLFNEVMVGGQQYAFDYIQRLPPHTLAGGMIGATKKLGDDSGFYFAMTGALGKPVNINPWRASQVNKAPNIEIVGSQGGGKSFLADLLGCKAGKLGAKALFIDPKGDRTLWPEYLQSFGEQVNVATFTAKAEDKGKLDPFNIMRAGATSKDYVERMKEAANLAMDIDMFLLASDRKDPRTAKLLQAVQRVVDEETPCMNRIIKVLSIMGDECEENDDPIGKNMCKEMSETLNSYRLMPYASLLFGDGDEKSIDFEKQINVLQIQNLTFPSQETTPDAYTYQEIIGYTCLLGISGFIMKFIMSDRGTLGLFIMDEASVINATPVGKNLVLKIQRMARALNKPGIFISQNVDDVGDEKVKNNIGYKFAFRSTDETEIRKVLSFYNLQPTRENIETIQNLGNGMCLFQDLDGRTGVIAVDAVFEEYELAFNTKPENKQDEQ